jgi:hypothetical protein
MGYSFGQPPSGISGAGPTVGPLESKRLPLDLGFGCGLGFGDGLAFDDGLGFGGGEVDAGVDVGVGVVAGADVLAEPPGLGEPGGAEALHSSTVTVHVAFADPMLR